jgi:23S rRNA pseudouridine2605 synthase
MTEEIRLQKMLAHSGVSSRRAAEVLISNGKVKVNGITAKLGDKVNVLDIVTLNGKVILQEKTKHYIALYKPRGYMTTMKDERGRKSVKDLIIGIDERVYPIGRLDKDSEGLIIMTNDGSFANKLLHPSSHIPKIYRVNIKGYIGQDILNKLKKPILINGKLASIKDVTIFYFSGEETILEFILLEGKNRQIRRLCERESLYIKKLQRIAIGNIKLGKLKPGEFRSLTRNEINSIYQIHH